MSHTQHPQPPELLGGVEDNRGEARGHLGVEADLDTSLDLVLALDEKIEQLLCVDDGLAEVGHQANQRCVPLVHDLSFEDIFI